MARETARILRVLSAVILGSLVVWTGGCSAGGHAAGAPAPATIPVGRSTQSIQWDGAERTFNLYRPQG